MKVRVGFLSDDVGKWGRTQLALFEAAQFGKIGYNL